MVDGLGRKRMEERNDVTAYRRVKKKIQKRRISSIKVIDLNEVYKNNKFQQIFQSLCDLCVFV